jgi:hypothetical protein
MPIPNAISAVQDQDLAAADTADHIHDVDRR